jgi:hypothetical protein
MKATGVAKGVYPISTGKVLIGRDYIPKRTQYATEAELFWQGVLLGRRTVRPSLSTSVISLCRFVRGFFRRG